VGGLDVEAVLFQHLLVGMHFGRRIVDDQNGGHDR